MKNLYEKYNLNSLIKRFGIRNMKIATITITSILAVIFVITVVLALIAHNNMTTYTQITM